MCTSNDSPIRHSFVIMVLVTDYEEKVQFSLNVDAIVIYDTSIKDSIVHILSKL